MLLAALALTLATADVVDELLRIPVLKGGMIHEPKCVDPRIQSVDLRKLKPMLASRDRRVRTRAANHLAEYMENRSLFEAVPLLAPWIGDPSWADETRKRARLTIVEHAGWSGRREAVPQLIRAVEHDPSPEIRGAAAWSLALIGDASGNAVMRNALSRAEGQEKGWIIQALLKTNGFTEAELRHAVDVYIDGDPRSDEWLLGAAVIGQDRSRFAARIVKSIDDQRSNSVVITNAVMGGDALRKHAAPELALMRMRGGIRAGLAAAIIGDPADMRNVLTGNDIDAIRALLAGARISRTPLPEAMVRDLPRRLPATAETAKAYLADAPMR